MTLIYIFLTVISVFTVMSFFSLYRISKTARRGTEIQGEKYYELKSEIKFISSVGTIIIGVLGFMGYQKYEDLYSRTQDVEKNLKIADEKIQKYETSLISLDEKSKTILGTVGLSKNELRDLKQNIDHIRNNNVLDKNFYFVDDLSIPNEGGGTKFYFDKLVTSIGDRLPFFKTPPTVLLAPKSSVNLNIIEVTNEYIEIGRGGYMVYQGTKKPEQFVFTLIVSKRE